MRVNPRMDGWKPHQCGWVYLSAAIPCPRNVCMFARLRCDAGRCQDVCLVPIPCVLASHGLEVLGETIAPIVPHKIPDCWHCSRRQHWCILWAVGAGRGSRESTIAFCHGGAGQGPYDQGQSWMSRCRFQLVCHFIWYQEQQQPSACGAPPRTIHYFIVPVSWSPILSIQSLQSVGK